MKDQRPPDNGANEADSSEFDRRVEELVESRLSDERLAKEWERWRGTPNQAGSTDSYTWRQQWSDIVSTLWMTRVLHKGVAVAAALLLGFLGWIMIQGTEINLRTPEGWTSVSVERLPGTLEIILRNKPRNSEIFLKNGLIKLSGVLGTGNRDGSGTTIRDASFLWTNSAGISVRFQGSLVLTNKPGVIMVHERSDFLGGTLVGVLTVGTNKPVQLEQPYQ